MRPRTTWLVALAVAVACSAATRTGYAGTDASSPSPSLPELLEKAIFNEETVGDLDAAIEIYRQIVEQGEADRSYVAQAQFRLGMCYVKQGKTEEAVETLRRLVADFPQQDELVETARARLAELGHALPEPGVVIRQAWAEEGELTLGTVSPDGRHVTFTDWSTGNVMLHDLTNGRNRNLTRETWPGFSEWSVISPDGKRVAYNWFNDDGLYDLRIVDLDGSSPRVLYADEEVIWLLPMAWSPDGRQVLATLTYRDRADRTVLVDAESGAVRVLEKLTGSGGSFSPDGRHIVYSRAPGENAENNDIFLYSLDGDGERPLVQHPANDRLLGWAPSGRHILFASDRTGTWGAWAVRVADGRPAGSPTLVKPGLGDTRAGAEVEPMGFTRDGSYYYGFYTDMSDVYFATLDPSEGGLSAPPTRATQRFEGTNGGPEWSPDGERIAFVSKRGGSWVIVTRALDTGEEREIPVPEFAYIGSGRHLRWSPDGRSFLVIAHRGDWRWGVFTIDADSGSVSALAWSESGGAVLQAQWSPDGKTVFFERRGEDVRITRLDLETGAESLVYPRQVGVMALSPDGRWMAFTTDVGLPADKDEIPTLWVVPASGGESRVLFRSTQSRPFGRKTALAWTPDGRHVIVGRGVPEGDSNDTGAGELWKIPVEGGEPRRLGVTPASIRHLRVHPDGKRIAFQSNTRKVEVWVMENFLPALEGEAVSEVRR